MSTKVMKHSKGSSKHRSITSPYLNSIYDQLNEQIDSILGDMNPVAKITISYQKLYKFVEFLCRDKLQSKITASLYEKIDAFLTKVVEYLVHEVHKISSADQLVRRYVEVSLMLEVKLTALEKIHLYLDRTYLLNHPTKKTLVCHFLYNLYNKLHDTKVDEDKPLNINNRLDLEIIGSFFTMLDGYRISGDETSVQTLIQAFQYLSKLVEDFNCDLIAQLHDFCSRTQSSLIEHDDGLDEVFDKMYNLIVQELRFWDKTTATDTFKGRVKYEMTYHLVFDDFDKLGVKFVKPLFVNKKFLSIPKLFKFIENSAPSEAENQYLKTFANIWYSYVCEYLETMLKENQQDIVEKLVRSKKNLTLIMEKYMNSNSEIEFKLREAFRTALHNSNKDTEILNKLLKYIYGFFKNADTADHDENALIVNDIYLIFKSVKTKATFMKQYQRDLSRRLITQTTKDKKLEKLLISKIQNEVGAEQCKPLVTMFDDLKISDTLVSTFKCNLSTSESDLFEGFNPLVLNSKAWPVPKATIKVPDEMNELMTKFQKFYLGSHQKKKLNWCPVLSHMSINAHFKRGDKELQVSTFQGIVILLFNEHDKLSFNEIKQMTELDSKNLSSILYSLTMGKYKILVKDFEGLYSMNDEFEDRKKVIKVKQIQMKLKNGEEENVWMTDENEFKQDKDEIIKAFIVRTMKFETEMDHDTLLQLIVDQFIVETADVKRIIQQLLESEYIERIETQRYKYVP